MRDNSGLTGRYLVAFDPDGGDQVASELKSRAGIGAVRSRDGAPAGANLVLDALGVAVVDAEPEQHERLMAAAANTASPIRMVEPERYVWAAMLDAARPARVAVGVATGAGLTPEGASLDFLRGYGAAIQGLLSAVTPPVPERFPLRSGVAEAATTWGIDATLVVRSQFSGHGVRLAVLDTGFDLGHPDFENRQIVSASFVEGEEVQDRHGHGTHTAGTACGPRQPRTGPRYGVAHGARLFVGKVLNNAGLGTDGQMLAGINWAVENDCAVVSMSIQAPVDVGQSFNRVFQRAAAAAERRGTLIIAAAGNFSSRPANTRPVTHPANCPTIIAVGAVDAPLQVASFSCGSVNLPGGEVNVAGPGVDVYSSWPLPITYRTIDGTSMATPHVAGIAALYAEATGLRGMALAEHFLRRSRRLAPVADFGWGFVQAP